MHFGAAWYPEHWPEERWPEDVRLMKEAGFTVCRVAEFAWSTMEPTEGQYQFAWLERAIAMAADAGLDVVLGTPTAAPPAWLTYHHPDTVAIEANGRAAQHGNRCHYSPTSSTYHKYARRIAEQMAKRFGPDERVMAWQIDNEYSRIDYSENSRRQFQAYLKEQFGSLDELNKHWSTAYWSQTYGDWNEIPIPVGGHNPGLMLEFKRFVSRVWRDFQKTQIDAIRQYARPEQWITHNFMGWFDGFDHYVVAKDLDLASWDWYVAAGHHDYANSGAMHDLIRGLKRKNFWIMETQPGSVNWAEVNRTLNRGEARCMAWHAIAHGADAILYWQWRPAPGGQEQLHGSLLGADGAPRPFYSEAKQLGQELRKVNGVLEAAENKNQVAILHTYESRWSINWQKHNRNFDPVELLLHFYRPLIDRNIGVDILGSDADFGGYKLLIASGTVILTDAMCRSLQSYVEQGGLLVLTVRCGQKDAYNALFPTLQPGPLREIAGAEVAEYYALDQPAPVDARWQNRRAGEGTLWAEMLRPLHSGTQTLASYGECNGWLDGAPAVTMKQAGPNGGAVVMVGTVLDSALQDSLTTWLLAAARVQPELPDSPPGVEIARRVRSDGTAVHFYINHTAELKEAPLHDRAEDLLSGEHVQGSVILEPYAVKLFQSAH